METKTEINRLYIVLAHQVQHIADSAKKYLTGFSEAPMVVLMSTGAEMTRGKIAWTFSPLYHHHHLDKTDDVEQSRRPVRRDPILVDEGF